MTLAEIIATIAADDNVASVRVTVSDDPAVLADLLNQPTLTVETYKGHSCRYVDWTLQWDEVANGDGNGVSGRDYAIPSRWVDEARLAIKADADADVLDLVTR
jgi:hypothetical protein